MSWIKIESHLRTKPEVIDIADKLGIKDTHAQGVCLAFWQWMDGITTNGTAKARRSMIDKVVDEEGFADALESVGWLVVDEAAGTITMPNWDRHSGETAKDRALNSRRQKRHRDKANNADVTDDSDDSNASVTQERYATVTKVTQGPLPEKRREEEKREEKITSSSPTPSSDGGGGFVGIHAKPTPEATAAASAWQQPATAQTIRYFDPDTGSTAGFPTFNPHCCQILKSGTVLAESPKFAAFMKAYPKPDKRQEAADAWNMAIIAGADPDHMIAAISVEPSLRKPPEERKFLPCAKQWIADKKYLVVQHASTTAKPAERPKPTREQVLKERREWEQERIQYTFRYLRNKFRHEQKRPPTPEEEAAMLDSATKTEMEKLAKEWAEEDAKMEAK